MGNNLFWNSCYGRYTALVRHGIGIENLNPIAIGILNKSQSLHTSIVGPLDKVHTVLLKAV